MKRYFKLILSFCRFSFLLETEYRLAFLMWLLSNLLWSGVYLLAVELIFGQVTQVAGWTKGETLVLSVIAGLFVSIIWFFILPNLVVFHNYVRRGDLDFILTKPLNSRFLVTFRKFEFDMIIRLIPLGWLLWFFLGQINVFPNLLNWLSFLVYFGLGVFIYYNFCFVLTTLNFWLTNIFNLEHFFVSVHDMSAFPADIFKGSAKILFLYLIPSVFFSTIPTKALLGNSSWQTLMATLIMAAVGFIFSQWFWNFALKHYSSASS